MTLVGQLGVTSWCASLLSGNLFSSRYFSKEVLRVTTSTAQIRAQGFTGIAHALRRVMTRQGLKDIQMDLPTPERISKT